MRNVARLLGALSWDFAQEGIKLVTTYFRRSGRCKEETEMALSTTCATEDGSLICIEAALALKRSRPAGSVKF